MPKKKSSAKLSKAVKPAKKVKPVIANYLAPLHEVTLCIENDYDQLKKLLETIPAKIEKEIAACQAKLKKSKEAQIKSEKALANTKQKQKAKPLAKNKQDLVKHEKYLSELKVAITTINAELKELSEQLQTCKKMKTEHTSLEKMLKKTKSEYKKQAAKKPQRKTKNSKGKPSDKNQTKTLPTPEELTEAGS